MTIDKAIRQLSDQIDLITKDRDYPIECAALKLGIEALKRIRDARAKGYDFSWRMLPEETKE